MTRLNSRQRKRIYKLLVDRDGEKCKKCGRKPPNEVKKLVIDRIENQGDYSDIIRLQLLCFRCNYLKNPRIKEREPLDERESVYVNPENMDLDHRTSIDINKEMQPKVLPYLEQRLDDSPNGVDYGDIVQSLSFVFTISPITADRYVKPYCRSVGPFEIIQDGKRRILRRKNKVGTNSS